MASIIKLIFQQLIMTLIPMITVKIREQLTGKITPPSPEEIAKQEIEKDILKEELISEIKNQK
jgi:hypothetical protein